MKRQITIGEDTHNVAVIRKPEGAYISVDDGPLEAIKLQRLEQDNCRISVGEHSVDANITVKGESVFIEAFGELFSLEVLNPVEEARAASEEGDLSAKSPMPGTVVELHVQEGDVVEADQPLVTIESMKLLTIIRAAGAGIVTSVNYQAGDVFNKGAVLAVVQAPEEDHA